MARNRVKSSSGCEGSPWSTCSRGTPFYVKLDGRANGWIWGTIAAGRSYPWVGKFESREEVNRYFEEEQLTCLLCGRRKFLQKPDGKKQAERPSLSN